MLLRTCFGVFLLFGIIAVIPSAGWANSKCLPGYVLERDGKCYLKCPSGWEKALFDGDYRYCGKNRPWPYDKSESKCPKNYYLKPKLGVCTKKCKSGYKEVGLRCYKNGCPSGFKEKPRRCKKPKGYNRGIGRSKRGCEKKYGRGKCEKYAGLWYKKCKKGYYGWNTRCRIKCPKGMKDKGLYCTKKNYKRKVKDLNIHRDYIWFHRNKLAGWECDARCWRVITNEDGKKVQDGYNSTSSKCRDGYSISGIRCWRPKRNP